MAGPKGNKNAVGNSGLPPQKYTKEWMINEAQELLAWAKKRDEDGKVIFINRFALEHGYHPQRLAEFADKSIEFAAALKLVKEYTHMDLYENGLRAEYNPGFAKFCLVNNHGYKEHLEEKDESAKEICKSLVTSYLKIKNDKPQT
jgi:hypothetical protein